MDKTPKCLFIPHMPITAGIEAGHGHELGSSNQVTYLGGRNITITINCYLPVSRKLEVGVEPGLQPTHSTMGMLAVILATRPIACL